MTHLDSQTRIREMIATPITTTAETPDYDELLAAGIAARLPEFGFELSHTGLAPEAILESVVIAMCKTIPQFKTAPQEIVNEFCAKLADAIRNRVTLETDLETVRRQGLRPS